MTERTAQPTPAAGASPLTTVFSVPEGKKISLGAPSLIALPNKKLLIAFDQTGPDVKGLPGKKGHDVRRNRWLQGRIMSSSDGGASWHLAATYPFRRASLFREGSDIYLVGEASGGLCLMRSPDGGHSWSAPVELTEDLDLWLAPTPVRVEESGWLLPCLAPAPGGGRGLCVWRAPRGASLMNRRVWSQGPVTAAVHTLIPADPKAGFGVPAGAALLACHAPLLIQVADSKHPWHSGNTRHLLCAIRSGRQHWAVLWRLSLTDLSLSVQTTPNGAPWTWIPLPGGHDKFDLFYDEATRRYGLIGSRGRAELALEGSATPPEEAPHRLGVWTSGNLADWLWAGELFNGGGGPAGVRADPAAAICGNDLIVACRAGGPQSRSPRETTQILFARWPDFRARWP